MVLARMLIVASVLGAASILAGIAFPATQQFGQQIDRPQTRQVFAAAPAIYRSPIHNAEAAVFTMRLSELLKLARRLAIKT